MNKTETVQILALLQSNYPESFRGMSDEAVTVKVNLWADMFRDYPAALVLAAVKAYIASHTDSFMPNVGQIMEQIDRIQNPAGLTEQEAWGLVFKALRNSAYGYREEFAQLPPDIQRCVGSPEMLHEWAGMDADQVQSVVASNFQRSYRARAVRDAEYRRIPADVRKFLSGVAEKMALTGGTGEEA